MLSSELKKSMLPPKATIKDAMSTLTLAGGGIILVTDHETHLLGVVVDSDIRRALLKGYKLESPLSEFMTFKPFTLPYGTSRSEIKAEFKRHPRAFIPLIDEEGRVRDLARMVDFFKMEVERPNWVFLMAGGLGIRLRPMTNDRPKPMVSVGDKPIMEIIIEQFLSQGFKNFIVAVNHLQDQIREYFGDGRHWGATIEYVDEGKKMGTAGALSLIDKELIHPLIVMNADLLTKMEFSKLIEFHQIESGKATVCVREYNIQIPFGVIEVNNDRLTSIDEKPVQKFFVNAGIYVFEPETLSLLDKSKATDMPEFLENVNKTYPNSITCFPITEYWMDIGRVDDYEKAQKEYDKVFRK